MVVGLPLIATGTGTVEAGVAATFCCSYKSAANVEPPVALEPFEAVGWLEPGPFTAEIAGGPV